MHAGDLPAGLRDTLAGALAGWHDDAAASAGVLCDLARDGPASLPLPGAGATLDRWRALAAVIRWTNAVRVNTSVRRVARAPDVFAAHLQLVERRIVASG